MMTRADGKMIHLDYRLGSGIKFLGIWEYRYSRRTFEVLTKLVAV
jgi:hypothetical protein